MIRRRWTEGSCKNGRRCLEHLRFDVMYQGQRYRIAANDFAIPRTEPGTQRPIQSMEEARDWERRFIGRRSIGAWPQPPPLLGQSPFHRFGVRSNKKAEVARDRRISRDEEKRLLDTALRIMNTPEHQDAGKLLHDRIIGALELCCRRWRPAI